ncbi:MAG: response regulator [Aquimonas sp.]|nr:response regulator [Aquimonas sp.]
MSRETVLLVEDDAVFGRSLARALERRGVGCTWVEDPAAARQALAQGRFDYAILDLKLGEHSGLPLVPELHALAPELRILLLTGYASVATAVEAIKRGAIDYLPKPASADMILRALRGDAEDTAPLPEQMTPLSRIEWEHIQQALHETGGNLSAAARLLGMHRRSLQRKLAKRPVAEP